MILLQMIIKKKKIKNMKNYHNVKVYPPEGYEIDKSSIIDNTVVVTFKKVKKKLPKSWEELCSTFPLTGEECFIDTDGNINDCINYSDMLRDDLEDTNFLPNYATAEAVLALCKLIQLRNAYNGDWVPNWRSNIDKYIIYYQKDKIVTATSWYTPELLYFKTKEMCDEFFANFRPLIEKLKPLYGIKEGGKE